MRNYCSSHCSTAGLHSVTVTDNLGYETTCEVTIEQPQAALSATAAINIITIVLAVQMVP
jgi:hypothetical protein